MRILKYFVTLLCVLLASSAWSQELNKRLSNQNIIEMVSLGLSDEVIIAKIRRVSESDGLKFDTSVDGLKTLKADEKEYKHYASGVGLVQDDEMTLEKHGFVAASEAK